MLAALPENIREAALHAYRFFLEDPFHPALNRHDLNDTKRGRHRKGSVAISITRRYRAIFVRDGATNVWYWIGSHESYNNFIGK